MANDENEENIEIAEELIPFISATAKFSIGMAVQHKKYDFRGVIFDVDPTFSNTEEWWRSIPKKIRPKKDQPFYHLFAISDEDSPYIAYVSEQNLIADTSGVKIVHPAIAEFFDGMDGDCFKLRQKLN